MGVPLILEKSRTHNVTGAFGAIGGGIAGATNASPIVITTTSAHGLISGDPVQVTGVLGNTAANRSGFAQLVSATQFRLFSDSALSLPIAGNGAYTSGGAVSEALDVSAILGGPANIALCALGLQVETLTAGKNCEIAFQTSLDGFVSDIEDVAIWSTRGLIEATPTDNRGVHMWLPRELKSSRFGVAGARLRLSVTALDAGATVQVSAWVEVSNP